MLVTGYKCSVEADALWRRLLSIYARAATGDAQAHGRDWGEWGPPGGEAGYEVDVGTDDRILYLDCQRALAMLEARPEASAKTAARLAYRRLTNHGWGVVLRQCRVTREEAEELLDGAKEFVHWSCRDTDAPLELPELPF